MNYWQRNYRQARTGLLLGLALGGAGAAQAGYPEQISALSPLGYWRLNETTQPAAADIAANRGSAGAAATGYYSTANVNHSVTGALAGSSDTAVWLNGSSGKVSVPWTDGVQNLKPPFTVEFWVNTDTASFGSVPLSNADRANGRSGWLFYEAGERANASTIAGQAWNFWLGDAGGYTISLAGTTAVQAGVWYQVAGVYDGTNAYLYVNGVQEATGSGAYQPNEAQPLTIGTRYDGTAYSFGGSVDEVALYPSALSAAELLAHYKNGVSSAPATAYDQLVLSSKPVAYYRLNEAAYTEPTSYPVAKNAGGAGAAANGAIHPGVAVAEASAPFTGFGTDNYAAQFNGYQGYVDLGNPAELNFTGEITLLAWVNPNSTSSSGLQDIIIHGYGASSEVGLRLNSGSYQAFSYDGSDHAASYAIPGEDVGNWVFLAGTYDGAQWNLYRNGALVATKTDTVGAVTVDDVNWAIGAKGDGTERYFDGRIDEVAVFGKSLTAAQIAGIYEAANVPPFITTQPQAPAGALYAGNDASLFVAAVGTRPIAYQWRKDGAAIAGATASNWVANALAVADSGAYDVVITNGYGAITSAVVNLSIQVASAPIITTAPRAQTRYAGAQANFVAAASGSTPLAFQWLFNDTNTIAGATGASYQISSVALADAGQYRVVITNAFGAVTSAPVALTVQAAPTTGYAQAVLADAPVSYWRLNESAGAWAQDSLGRHDAQYLNVALGQPGYSALDADTAIRVGPAINSRVVVPDLDFSSGANFSLEAWVKVVGAQSGDVGVLAKGTGGGGEQFDLDIYGGSYRFFVRDTTGATKLISSTGSPDGQWQHLAVVYDATGGQIYLYLNGEVVGSTETASGGLYATTNRFSIGARQSGSGDYDYNVNGFIDEVAVYATALSAERVTAHYLARYGANTAPIIRAQPVAATHYLNATAAFSVEAGGSDTLAYQWQYNGADLDGANLSTLTVGPLTAAQAGNYRVKVTNAAGAATSEAVALTVLPAPTTPVDISAGQILHLAFDGDYQDVSTRGNHGAKVNSPAFVAGKVGAKALHVATDASAQTYNYVSLGKPADFNFSSNASFSVVYWVRLPAGALPGDLPFFTSANNSTYNTGFTFAPSYQKGGWAWSLNGTGVYGADASINDGEWHHLAHIFDRAGFATTYLDGALVDNRLIVGRIGDIDTGHTVNIGQDPTGAYGETGEADLDDLGVWRRALTVLEIEAIYAAGSQGVSFTATAVAEPSEIKIQRAGGQATLTWTSGTLQAADTVNGAWSDVAGAASPYAVSADAGAKFYRLKN